MKRRIETEKFGPFVFFTRRDKRIRKSGFIQTRHAVVLVAACLLFWNLVSQEMKKISPGQVPKKADVQKQVFEQMQKDLAGIVPPTPQEYEAYVEEFRQSREGTTETRRKLSFEEFTKVQVIDQMRKQKVKKILTSMVQANPNLKNVDVDKMIENYENMTPAQREYMQKMQSGFVELVEKQRKKNQKDTKSKTPVPFGRMPAGK